MGRAYTGVADDIDSLYWNPGGLGTYRSSQVELQHSPLVDGASYQYFAYSQPVYTFGGLGAGIVNLQSGSISKIGTLGTEIGSFRDRQTAYLLGYGHRF